MGILRLTRAAVQCEDLFALTEVPGVVVVGADVEAAQVSVRRAAVLTDRGDEAVELGKPVDGPVLGVDPEGVAEERPDLVLVSSLAFISVPST